MDYSINGDNPYWGHVSVYNNSDGISLQIKCVYGYGWPQEIFKALGPGKRLSCPPLTIQAYVSFLGCAKCSSESIFASGCPQSGQEPSYSAELVVNQDRVEAGEGGESSLPSYSITKVCEYI